MAVSASKSGRMEVLQASSRKWKEERDMSRERNKMWTEPPDCKIKSQRKVPVVYYLCRNGQLEHPHFMEVTLSPSEGLYLKDVINRLNFLRGKGMASMYSWSCKRSYKNGFVWQDLTENDFLYPAQGQEYVLKGSELLENPLLETAPLQTPPTAAVGGRTVGLLDSRRTERRLRNQSCSSIDFNLHEYSAYKAESSARAIVDGSTQTDDNRRRRRSIKEAEEKSKESYEKEQGRNQSREEIEISPPPSDSSPETLETLMKADGRVILRSETVNEDPAVNNQKVRTSSSVLMQLISCGSNSFKDCGPTQRLNLISQYKMRLPRGLESSRLTGGIGRVKLEEKEYFSGSLVETKKEEFPALKRSSSYNADRSSQLEEQEKEMKEVRAKCIPRTPKNHSTRKDASDDH